jgi:hypothetical protein
MTKPINHSEKIEIITEKFDEDKLRQELAKLISEKGLDTYHEGYVGFFSRGDAIGAIGGGMGAFLWFPSFSELYQFLANYFVVLSPGQCDLDHEKVFNEVARIVKELAEGKINKETAIQKINKAAQHFSQIEWIGELDDLIQGDGEFPKKVREYFFESREDEGSVKEKIGKDHQEAFLEFLGEYGI